MRTELKDQESIRNNVEKLKKAKKEAEKVKDFVVSVNDLVDMEKTYLKLQNATSDKKLNGDSAGFGFVHCDRSIIDKFLALKEKLKVKGVAFQTVMACDADVKDISIKEEDDEK